VEKRTEMSTEVARPPVRSCLVNHPLRVLVHAGDPDRGAVAAGLLRAAGWTVVDDHPDAAVLVLGASGPVDPDAVVALRERHPGARVVILAADDRRSGDLRRLLRAGADAVVFDAQAEACLALTVLAVHAGQIVVPRSLRQHVVRSPLSHREKQILRLVVRGFTNRQIADELYLAESTVKTHLSSAFAKLDTHSRAEVTELILDPDDGRGLGILGVADVESRVA
jgi:DNA-binding NarL/FixJ family response regulator